MKKILSKLKAFVKNKKGNKVLSIQYVPVYHSVSLSEEVSSEDLREIIELGFKRKYHKKIEGIKVY